MKIRIENIKKIYKDAGSNVVCAVSGISTAFQTGDLVSIMGPSGCGKTTLLNLIGCVDVPTEGKIWFEDRLISDATDEERAEFRNKYVGYILQEFGLINTMTVEESIGLPFLFSKRRWQERERIHECLEKTGLVAQQKRLVSKLSGGQRQRVAIARALLLKPEIVLADEPTGSLDSSATNDIMKVLLDVNSEGSTVIIVTHDPEVATLCIKRYKMRDGFLIS
ncbi:MAG: ABC transporter ATP-binding protein [Clostridia bacterium]|nr:ABC transporter ATP-binding protein [Clostridia bacterium]